MTIRQARGVEKQLGQQTQFPTWVIRKIGVPILTEAVFAGAMPNGKWGIFKDSTGTLAQETSKLFYGGTGSCKILTAATNNDSCELKNSHDYIVPSGWLISLEHKWTQEFAFAGTNFDMGIENRSNPDIRHVRFRYSITSGEWKFQDVDQSYKSFPASIGGALTPEKPVVSTTAGTKWSYARCIIDPLNNLYVGFESSGKSAQLETRDMRSMAQACCTQGASTAWELLFFVLNQAGGNGAEASYTTDWCISLIPPWVDPFVG